MIILILLFYGFFIWIEAVPLWKKGKKRELLAYGMLMGAAFVINSLLVFNVKIPSPADPIKQLVMLVGGGGK